MHCRSYSISVTLVVRSWFPVTKRAAFRCILSRAALSFWWCRGPMHYRPTGILASQEPCTRSINSSGTYTTVRPCRCGVRCKKNNIFRGIKEFVWVVMMSSCSGTILSIFGDVREIQRRYCRLYLGIKISSAEYPDYLWCSCSAQSSVEHFDHTSCASLSFAELEFQLSIPLQIFTNQTRSEGQSYLAVKAQQNESHHLLITSAPSAYC